MNTRHRTPEMQGWIDQSQGLVRALAMKIHSRLPSSVNFDDVFSYGQVGLMQAVNNFKPETGAQFQTFAYYRIRGAIYDGLAKMSWTSRSMLNRLRAEQLSVQLLEQQLEAAAKESGHTSSTLASDAQWLVQTAEKLAVVQLLSGTTDSTEDPLANLADGGQQPDEEVASREICSIIKQLVKALPEVERRFIEMTYYEGKSMTEAAEAMGKSKSWASRLHSKIIERLGQSATLSNASSDA